MQIAVDAAIDALRAPERAIVKQGGAGGVRLQRTRQQVQDDFARCPPLHRCPSAHVIHAFCCLFIGCLVACMHACIGFLLPSPPGPRLTHMHYVNEGGAPGAGGGARADEGWERAGSAQGRPQGRAGGGGRRHARRGHRRRAAGHARPGHAVRARSSPRLGHTVPLPCFASRLLASRSCAGGPNSVWMCSARALTASMQTARLANPVQCSALSGV